MTWGEYLFSSRNVIPNSGLKEVGQMCDLLAPSSKE